MSAGLLVDSSTGRPLVDPATGKWIVDDSANLPTCPCCNNSSSGCYYFFNVSYACVTGTFGTVTFNSIHCGTPTEPVPPNTWFVYSTDPFHRTCLMGIYLTSTDTCTGVDTSGCTHTPDAPAPPASAGTGCCSGGLGGP